MIRKLIGRYNFLSCFENLRLCTDDRKMPCSVEMTVTVNVS